MRPVLKRERERSDLERARRASVPDKEPPQQRAREMADGASISVPATSERITTNSAAVDVGTTKSGPVNDLLGSCKSYPPTCR